MKLATKAILSVAVATAASTAVLTSPNPAVAFQLKITPGDTPNSAFFSPAGGSTILNFESLPGTGSISSANFGPISLTASNTTVGDDGSGDKFLTPGSRKLRTQGSVTFGVNNSDAIPYFGLFWTNVKAADYLTLALKSGSSRVFTGSQIAAEAIAANLDPLVDDFYINFYEYDVAKRFTSLTVTSRGSFVDNVAYRVPTPALLPGLIGLGVAALRKRKAEATEKASAEV